MRPTYQHTIIADHLQRSFGHRKDWPFRSASEIVDKLCRERMCLSQGEYVVVGLAGAVGCIGKVADLEGLSSFPSPSLVISYHQLERAFHEQHTDWVEL